MAKQQRGLGKGLESLIPTVLETEFDPTADAPQSRGEKVLEIPVDQIKPNPHQPRQTFKESELKDLAASINQHGIVQPLIVIAAGKQYQLIAGERRLRAAKLLRLKTVPAIVRSFSDQQQLELALIENLQRSDLNPIETATAYSKLMDQFNLTQEQIGKRVGKERSTVANSLRLLNLPLDAKRALAAAQITEGHARAILALTDPAQQEELLHLILQHGWTVRQAEEFGRGLKLGGTKQGHKRLSSTSPQAEALERYLSTKVKIINTAKGGKVEIAFTSEQELERILNSLLPPTS